MAIASFELGISLGEISNVRFERTTVPKLDDAWFVQLDGEVVTVHARGGEIGRAAWVQSRLIERTGKPTDDQWKRVGTALARVLKRAAPEKRRIPRFLIGPIILGLLAVVATAVIFVVRTDEPREISLAMYGDLLWSDVRDGSDVMVPRVLRNAERERGRKLCVDGVVDKLELARLDGRDVHQGRLSFGDASIPFVALGSARSIVTRYAARFCGIADGKQVVGLFDLPDNRSMVR